MATRMQLEVFGAKLRGHPYFYRKIQQQSLFFYTDVDNGERARARDKNHGKRILLEKQHENFISAERK